MATRLKILVLTNLYPPQVLGGYERAIADFASLFKQRGHEVLVLTSDTPEITTNCAEPAFKPTVHRSLLLGGKWGDRGAERLPPDQLKVVDANNINVVLQALQTLQPDVCLVGNIDFFGSQILQPILAARIPIAHYVMNAHPGYPPDQTPTDPWHRYITCSDWICQGMQQLGYPIETTHVIYPGAAVEQFYQATLPPRDSLRLAYASLVMPYKGAGTLVEALCLLNAEGLKFTATIAGGTFLPDFVQALQQLIEAEGMQAYVQLPGVLSRQALSDLYKTCNVLVFPSQFEEPFGISQIEAMAAGLTLVTSATGGAREIVNHGQDGLIFEPGDPFDLAHCLASLPTQPEVWSALAQAGQQKAIAQFSQTKAVEQLEVVFDELITLAAKS